MNAPLVSVIMPIYNAARYLRAAVASVLVQTMRDLELIAVDDASSDESLSIARELAAGDSRLRVESLRKNAGAASARDAAIAVARGRYLAFLDADDIAVPHRLATQLAAVERCPGPAIACSPTLLIGPSGEAQGRSGFLPLPAEIAPTLLFANVIVASTVLTQREGFPGFRSGYEPAEDYDAWLRCLPGYAMLYHAKPLVHYRVHAAAVSSRQGERMKAARARIVSETLVRLGLEPSDDDVAFHLSIADGTFAPTAATLERAEAWLLLLREANQSADLFSAAAFAATLSRYWTSVCNGCWQAPADAARRLVGSPLAPPWRHRWRLSVRLRLRALVR